MKTKRTRALPHNRKTEMAVDFSDRLIETRLYGKRVHGQTGLEGRVMKLGDGSKVTMHKMPECLERAELRTEYSSLLSEWLALKDAVTMTGRSDPQYADRVEEAKAARAKLKAQEALLNEHVASNGCW
jgi:hypothetical protein